MRRKGWRVLHLPDAKLVHIHGATTKKVVPLPTRIEYHRSLYHFFRKNRGVAQARGVMAVRLVKLVLALVLGAPLTLFSKRERERWVQRGWILLWHLRGQPIAWGLAGVRAKAEGGA
jgi:GT2 family glycosyltransferase